MRHVHVDAAQLVQCMQCWILPGFRVLALLAMSAHPSLQLRSPVALQATIHSAASASTAAPRRAQHAMRDTGLASPATASVRRSASAYINTHACAVCDARDVGTIGCTLSGSTLDCSSLMLTQAPCYPPPGVLEVFGPICTASSASSPLQRSVQQPHIRAGSANVRGLSGHHGPVGTHGCIHQTNCRQDTGREPADLHRCGRAHAAHIAGESVRHPLICCLSNHACSSMANCGLASLDPALLAPLTLLQLLCVY